MLYVLRVKSFTSWKPLKNAHKVINEFITLIPEMRSSMDDGNVDKSIARGYTRSCNAEDLKRFGAGGDLDAIRDDKDNTYICFDFKEKDKKRIWLKKENDLKRYFNIQFGKCDKAGCQKEWKRINFKERHYMELSVVHKQL
jgi:hypothetical protein